MLLRLHRVATTANLSKIRKSMSHQKLIKLIEIWMVYTAIFKKLKLILRQFHQENKVLIVAIFLELNEKLRLGPHLGKNIITF